MIHSTDDTICAPATPPGSGGLGILRISGPRAFEIADRVLRQRRPCGRYRGHTLHRALVAAPSSGETIDDVLVAVFHAPRSYTGDDTVEISCHGGPVPMRRSYEALIEAGARPAEAGEFTFRAFMNGKLDLAQAEAVCDIVAARTDEALRAAQATRRGALSTAVGGVRDALLGILARIEASIDFPEDVGELDVEYCRAEVERASDAIDRLLQTARRGMLYRQGARVVLLGRPNVGKSSLMNALLRTPRAIVTPVPGTTRDSIEEALDLRGIPVRLVDTAGLRETEDPVERLGVEISEQAAAGADLALIVLDASEPLDDDDRRAIGEAADRPKIILANKIDAVPGRALPLPGALPVSALSGEGIDALEEAIADVLLAGAAPATSDAVVTRARQRDALLGAKERLADAVATIARDLPADFIAIDVRGAIDALQGITGATTADDVIDEIFSRFCIGK